MKRKLQIGICIIFFAILIALLFCGHHTRRQGQSISVGVPQNTNVVIIANPTNGVIASSTAAKNEMSDEDRLRWLEQNGEVPKDADYRDWYLSQKTTWWGKPLDPESFWKDRPIWLDDSTTKDAKRHGRLYPPLPSSELGYVRFSDKDIVEPFTGGVETPSFAFHITDREMVFWDDFAKTHLKPPADLDQEAEKAAKDFFNASFLKAAKAIGIEVLRDAAKNDGKALNYPPEEFTDDALFWTYVMNKRKELEQDIKMGLTTNSPIVKHLFQKLAVDAKLITDPLSSDQIEAANSWKISYLQRLQKENVDKSYIDAYLKAWNLTPEQVFGSN